MLGEEAWGSGLERGESGCEQNQVWTGVQSSEETTLPPPIRLRQMWRSWAGCGFGRKPFPPPPKPQGRPLPQVPLGGRSPHQR